jgi:uncharacterized peroxidase-related enzyme
VGHTDDLRAEVAAEGERAETEADRRMLDFAVKLTCEPSAMTREDVESLRAMGFSDTAIHDIVQITGFFAYYNRLAEGLGIDPEA